MVLVNGFPLLVRPVLLPVTIHVSSSGSLALEVPPSHSQVRTGVGKITAPLGLNRGWRDHQEDDCDTRDNRKQAKQVHESLPPEHDLAPPF